MDARVAAVDAIGIPVQDLERSVDFFTAVLSFQKLYETEFAGPAQERLLGLPGVEGRLARLQLGAECIELVEYVRPRGRVVPADSQSNDQWFQHVALIVPDMEPAYRWLRQHQVSAVSPAPQRLPDWNKDAGGIWAFYFKDPDGHPLEVLQLPPGKGDPRWHAATAQLFLGIDHTALVCRDTEASLRFYRDYLGLKIAGASDNYGPEQERLNNVPGAHLRITTLRAARGPGIELLEYRSPQGGRPCPPDSRANDLWHWYVRVEAAGELGSPDATALPADRLGPAKGLLLRDPDQHAMLLLERPSVRAGGTPRAS